MRSTIGLFVLVAVAALAGCEKPANQVELETPAYDEAATDEATTIYAKPRLGDIRAEQPAAHGEDAAALDSAGQPTVPLGNDGHAREGRISDLASPTPEQRTILAPPGTKPYTIAKGDNYWNIATRLFGDGQRWRDIRDLNPGVDPTKLRIGQVIVVPEK
jgi:nucleoid-associated protein YgaU